VGPARVAAVPVRGAAGRWAAALPRSRGRGAVARLFNSVPHAESGLRATTS
jgi:hypothetical protein